MKIRAKMQVTELSKFAYGERAKLGCVYSTSGENADFATATPSGGAELQLSPGTAAIGFFEPGVEYYVTFERVPKPEAAHV